MRITRAIYFVKGLTMYLKWFMSFIACIPPLQIIYLKCLSWAHGEDFLAYFDLPVDLFSPQDLCLVSILFTQFARAGVSSCNLNLCLCVYKQVCVLHNQQPWLK